MKQTKKIEIKTARGWKTISYYKMRKMLDEAKERKWHN